MEREFPKDIAIRKRFMVPEAFMHPAKANWYMMEWVFDYLMEKGWLKEGDLVLDPMCGIGTTNIVASLKGIHSIGIEYEQKFVDVCVKNKQKLTQVNQEQLFPKKLGKIVFLKGDARDLSILNKIDAIIISPPYEQVVSPFTKGCKMSKKKGPKIGCFNIQDGYSEDKSNIGNLKYGDIDAIITSPPYSRISKSGNFKIPITEEEFKEIKKRKPKDIDIYHDKRAKRKGTKYEYYKIIWREKYGEKTNIDNFEYGNIDAIITSPPYSEGIGHDSGQNASIDYKERLEMQRRYTRQMVSGGNIAKLKHGEVNTAGNLKKETYLEAMLKVYQECYNVLKPNGVMVLITKNFVRNKEIVPLDKHTILLCEKVGFQLIERHARKINYFSFWQILRLKRNEKIVDKEDILIFQKKK